MYPAHVTLLQSSCSFVARTQNRHPKPTLALKVKLKMLRMEGAATMMMTAMEQGIVGFEGADL